MEDELLAITLSIQDNLILSKQIIQIPLEELQSNVSKWKDAWILTIWKEENLNPSQVIHTNQMKWKVSKEKNDMVLVTPNRFVCKIHAKEDDGKVKTVSKGLPQIRRTIIGRMIATGGITYVRSAKYIL
ncbi:hypothetical protein FRX31_033988 [Thalictrum thalictroides]|uniref:Uncharacterized protein n=1 Tax=Thalictrum thalictroides TaxID=46969 RepID=A0A7J6UW58_THATH|nr:hypothetical protein FRX31_033988 [Thalictrum thalictroides]